MQKVEENNTVKVHYTGKLKNGQVFDSSANREPLEFTVGEGKLIPGFEKGVLGMAEGESKELEVSSDQAYGEVKEEMIHEIGKDKLPKDLDPKVGTQLVSKTPDGREFMVFIKKIMDDTVIIDANHPLAGEDLIFDIKVVDIQ